MKNVHRGLNYFGFICVCMSSFGFFTKILGGISRSQVDGHVTVPHTHQAS